MQRSDTIHNILDTMLEIFFTCGSIHTDVTVAIIMRFSCEQQLEFPLLNENKTIISYKTIIAKLAGSR